MIKKDYMYTGKAEWASELPAFLKAYNSTPQKVTGKTPEEVVEANAESLNKLVHKRLVKNAGNRRGK